MLTLVLGITAAAFVVWLLFYMLAQKPQTGAQSLLQQRRYEEALRDAEQQIARSPNDSSGHLHRAEAAKLMGRFDEAIRSYREVLRIDTTDAAAREGIALSFTYLKRDPQEARRIMEEALQNYPQIQEFQALALAFILLREGRREEALRLFEDNLVLLETRFRDDYTDPDPLLADTLFQYAELSAAAGDTARANDLRQQLLQWAPGSIFAKWVRPSTF
jgi:tetratricopeptide (TPR) repeat protein